MFQNLKYLNLFNYLIISRFIFNDDNYRGRKEVINLVESIDISILDLDEILLEEGHPTSYYTSGHGHFTENGYLTITNKILENYLAIRK